MYQNQIIHVIIGFKHDVSCIVRSKALRGHSDTSVHSARIGATRLVHWLILVAPSCLHSHNARYIMLKSLIRAFAASVMYWSYHSLALIHQSIGFEWTIHNCNILMGRAGVKYVFEFASTNTNTNTVYLYLHLIKFQTMYLYWYLYLIHCIWCIWQIHFQIHFFPWLLSKHKFMEHKLTWIFFINMLKSDIFFSK